MVLITPRHCLGATMYFFTHFFYFLIYKLIFSIRRLFLKMPVISLDREHLVLYSGPKRSESAEGQRNYVAS